MKNIKINSSFWQLISYVFVALIAGYIGFFLAKNQQAPADLISGTCKISPVQIEQPGKINNEKPTESKICTQEAKMCPNGMYVSRTGPNCEFSPCQTK
jgi:hypothetical protein